jgi:hypothetical protein
MSTNVARPRHPTDQSISSRRHATEPGRCREPGGSGRQRAAAEGDPGARGAIRPELLHGEGSRSPLLCLGKREQRERGRTRMAQPSQRTDGWPTILWISWREGDTERLEPLCRLHREHVFRDYPTSAHGLGRKGDHCSMCLRRESRIARVISPIGGTGCRRR